MGDEEGGAAFPGKHAADLGGAQAIGIGLDHAGAAHSAQPLLQQAIIGPHRIQIDGEDGAGQRGRVALREAAADGLHVAKNFLLPG